MTTTTCPVAVRAAVRAALPRIGKNAASTGHYSRSRPWVVAAALVVTCAAAAAADGSAGTNASDLTELTLDELLASEVVYAASKRIQSLRDAPSAVTVVTAAEIRQHGYRTLADVLRTLPSFYVTDDRNYSYVGVRGFDRPGDYSTRVLLLVNGLRTNDNVYEQAYVGNAFPIDVDLIDRIEVVRGPSAAIYGNSAFFAVVNVVTRHGRDFQGAELAAGVGSFGALRGRATYGRRFDSGVDVLVSASVSDTGGQRLYYPEFDDPATQGGVADNTDDEQSRSAFVSVGRGSLSLEAGHVEREKGVPTASFGTLFGDRRTRTVDAKEFVSLTYERAPAQDRSLMARVQYGSSEYRGDYVYVESEPYLNRDSTRGAWWGLEASLLRRAGGRHLLTLGGELQDNFRQDQKNFDEGGPGMVYQDSHNRSARWAFFAQDELTLSERATVYLGVRHDWYQTFGHQTSPRVAVVLGARAATTLKLLYGRAFRAPNDFELHYTGVPYKANPSLGPERIASTELVLERALRPGIRLSASAYHNRIEGLIALGRDPADELLFFQNSDGTESLGLEMGLEVKRTHGPSGRLSYSVQRSREHGTQRRLTNSPEHMAKLNVGLPLVPRRLSAAVDAQYMGSRRTLAGGEAGAHLLVNLTVLAHGLPGGLEVSGSLYNLLDARYADPGSEEHAQDLIPQDGRTFRLKLSRRF